MSMNPTFILQDTSGNDKGLALKLFGGEVLMAFRQTTLFWDLRSLLVKVKALNGGKSHQFPIMGLSPGAEKHRSGDELLGQSQPFGETVIEIDDRIVGHRFIASDDSMISHFDAMQPYALEIGQDLAIDADRKVACVSIKAAREGSLSGFHAGGNVVNRVGGGSTIADAYPESATGAANLRSDLRTLARRMDEDNVPEIGRAAVLTPHARSVLLYDNTGTLFSRDYIEGQNKILDRRIGRCEGFDLYIASSSSVPSTNVANIGPDRDLDKYDVDCRYTAGNVAAGTGQPVVVAFAGTQQGKPPVGMVVAQEFFTHVEFMPRHGGTFLMGQNYLGVDKLNVWCAGVIQGQLS